MSLDDKVQEINQAATERAKLINTVLSAADIPQDSTTFTALLLMLWTWYSFEFAAGSLEEGLTHEQH